MIDLFYPPLASKAKVGERIAILREIKGWKQEEMAERLGTGRTSLSNWEMGTSYPDAKKLAAIAEITGATLDYLILGRESTLPSDLEGAVHARHRAKNDKRPSTDQSSSESPDR